MEPKRPTKGSKLRRAYRRPVVTPLGSLSDLTRQAGTYGNKEPGLHDGNGYSPKKM